MAATPSEPSIQDPGRRRALLAASAAPFVATIPTGNAWSLSIYQCVETSAQNAASALNTGPADEWVRVLAKTGRFRTTNPSLTPSVLTLYSLDNGVTWYDGNGALKPAGTSGCSPAVMYCLVGGLQDTYVLAAFTAQPDANNAIGVTFQNFFPIAKTQANGGPSGNIPLFTSCLCSVNPDAISGYCP